MDQLFFKQSNMTAVFMNTSSHITADIYKTFLFSSADMACITVILHKRLSSRYSHPEFSTKQRGLFFYIHTLFFKIIASDLPVRC